MPDVDDVDVEQRVSVPVGEGEPEVDELCEASGEPVADSVCVGDPDIDAMAVDVMLLSGDLLDEPEMDGLPDIFAEREIDPVAEPDRVPDVDGVDDKQCVTVGEMLLHALADGVTDDDDDDDAIEFVAVGELVVDTDLEGRAVAELDIALDDVRDRTGEGDTDVDAESEAIDADAVTE